MSFKAGAAVLFAAALSLAACGDASGAAPAATKTTTAKASSTRDWTQVVVATPEGGFRMGNPDAPVKLLEFASLTCPHCRAFQQEGMPTLRSKYIASGKISYEYRPFILNGVDFAPSLLVRCQTPATAFNLIDAFYDQQPVWILPFTKPLPEDQSKRMQALTPEQQISAFATYGGLDAFMRTRGMTKAKFDQCTSDKAGIDKLTAIRDDADKNYGLTGT
ncbi:MAG: thioredoxin domain-containing protein, partial [Janthinobacterium lividum]